jgi:hypothetical protein
MSEHENDDDEDKEESAGENADDSPATRLRRGYDLWTRLDEGPGVHPLLGKVKSATPKKKRSIAKQLPMFGRSFSLVERESEAAAEASSSMAGHGDGGGARRRRVNDVLSSPPLGPRTDSKWPHGDFGPAWTETP